MHCANLFAEFNRMLVTLYIVHMGFKVFLFLFILYTDLYLGVLLEIFVFCFIYRRGVSFLFISFL